MGPTTPPRRQIRDTDITNLTDLLSSTSAKVILPTDTDVYNAAIARWSQAAAKPAGVVIQPTTPEEVGIITKYCNDNTIELAVKGGGHSTAGASSTDGGLLLYLESLRNVTVEDHPSEPGQKIFRIGGGCLWSDVDVIGAEHGLATVGGTVADTGVGGLTLGGGYGWLSSQHGLTIDCLISAQIVLANGEVLRASETENPDLFWAVCGAGQNFGVVTEFVMRAYEQGDMWIGLLLFPSDAETVGKVVRVVNGVYTPDSVTGRTLGGGRSMGGLGFSSPPPAEGKILTFVTIIYNGPESEGRKLWQPLLDLNPIMNTMDTKPYAFANQFLSPPPGNRSSMKGSSFTLPLSPSFVLDIHKMYSEFYTADPSDRGDSLLMYELYDPGVVVASSKGCFANRGTHMNALICPIWKREAGDADCRGWAREVNERFKRELERKDVETGEGGSAGGVAPRGKHGAVLLYGEWS